VLLFETCKSTNPRRVHLYLAEKGLDIPRRQIDFSANEQRSAEFLALNPLGRVPVLLLEDGTTITESAAIVEYLEELYPEPPMIGTTAVQRAQVRALERIGQDLITRGQLWLIHTSAYFADRRQNPEVAAAAKLLVDPLLDGLEIHLADQPFLAGDRVTVADCTVFAMLQSCRVRFDKPLADDLPRLDAWYWRFAGRPSAAY